MNSGELASLAGVTVRALRHYHQVGVLPEPPRSSNGYRDYGVQHLISVLRIKRLAALGVPLERIPAALEGTGDDHAALLDQLDRELAAEISRLTAQRDLVTQMREARVPADLPPELAPFVAAWASANPSPALARIDREQTILFAHLAGAEGMPHLVAMYQRISDPALFASLGNVAAFFDSITADTSDAELLHRLEPFVAALTPVVRDMRDGWMPPSLSDSSELFSAHTKDTLNPGQYRALELLGERIEHLMGDASERPTAPYPERPTERPTAPTTAPTPAPTVAP